ncbi:MAG: SMC-Scp complex subunit ScpB [Candidatus Omnitrophota bacterium]|nr:MAG: SMC-Scp complex subunit ScpB [Candidatus Omnitrophota bacterium]
MEQNEIKKIVEAAFFVSEKPLTFKQLSCLFEDVESGQLRTAIKGLMDTYNQQDRGINIFEVAGGYQVSTNPECARYLEKLYKTRKVFRLSSPALETLAIITYKQPITRSEVEFIRGVNVDGVIRTLLERGLIKSKGKKKIPGKPVMYGTTDDFLQYFGLKSLSDLPELEKFHLPEANLELAIKNDAGIQGKDNGQDEYFETA